MKRFCDYFIDRPIFATVVSLSIILLGLIGFSGLPISQYPDIVPPTIAIDAAYPGASPEVLAETVATPIEQELNGVERMMYMTSRCNSDGTMSIEIAFELGTDINAAQVLVQNRLEAAKPVLPEEVRAIGVRVSKRSPSLLLGIAIYSSDKSRDTAYVSNYYLTQMRDRILRVDGVGDVVAYGSREYSMRVWLDPNKMADLGIAPVEVYAAVRAQNKQVSAGKLNQAPVFDANAAFELPIEIRGRLVDASEFGEIVVRKVGDGRIVRLKDIARIELGAYSYTNGAFYKGGDAVALLVYQTPGSNASNTAGNVLKLLEEMKKDFPEGLDYDVGMDNTVYIADSIREVFLTILEATLLVVAVMMLFLQNWRAAVIPIFAIPISLVGTFFFMRVFGFTINNLTLFGLVLAIGIVVDDAIVVVENVDRNMRGGTDVKTATKNAMAQVAGALVAIVLVLSSVFVPTAFVRGIAGEFYRQFALTIAASTIVSGVVSLTLTPALSAILMRRRERPDLFTRVYEFVFGKFFGAFNALFEKAADVYGRFVRVMLKLALPLVVLYAALMAATYYAFDRANKGFIPAQDTCYFYVAVQLPDGATLERTAAVMQRAEKIVAKTLPEARKYMSLVGLNIANLGRMSNGATMFVQLEGKESRVAKGIALDDSIARLMSAFEREIPEALFFAVKPPVVSGVGMGGDFKGYVQDKSALGLAAVESNVKKIVGQTRKEPSVSTALTMFSISSPRIKVDLDREQAERMGVDVPSVFNAMSFNLGSVYINDFNILNRAYRVVAQAESFDRRSEDDIMRLRIPTRGGSAQIGSFAKLSRTVGPEVITRYNLYPAAEIMGNVSAGHSTGEAIAAVERIAAETLPAGMDIEWTDLAFQEKRVGSGGAIVTFSLCVVFVFLILAALYESWRLPLSVILIVPLVLLFSVLGVESMGLDVNVLTQVGFIVLIGLACKNAILIVEFAKLRQERGESAADAVSCAARNRLRPILMTSMAFIMGVLPLVIATGTGSELRNALGTPVFFGMIGVTAAGLVFTPVFFYIIRRGFKVENIKK